jgi:hypothetical protein
MDGRDHAARHSLLVVLEAAVDAGDDEVEVGEAGVGEVHRAVCLYVALDALEDVEVFQLLVEGVYLLPLLGEALLVEAVGDA